MGRMAYVCVEQSILNGFAFPYYILGKFPTIIGLFLFISDANCVPLHKNKRHLSRTFKQA